jgi:hypothetical protein
MVLPGGFWDYVMKVRGEGRCDLAQLRYTRVVWLPPSLSILPKQMTPEP